MLIFNVVTLFDYLENYLGQYNKSWNDTVSG